MSARHEEIQQGFQNDLMYICSSICYLQTCVDESYSRHAWPIPLPSSYAQRLLSSGPPFDPWVPPLAPSEAQAPPEDPDFQEKEAPFVLMTKRRSVI